MLPSGLDAVVDKIDTIEGPLQEAFPPMSVTITLDRDIDISRGNMIVPSNNLPEVSQDIDVMVCWFNERPMQLRGKYVVLHTTQEARCMIKEIYYKVNINTLENITEDVQVGMNDVAKISIRTTAPLFYDSYRKNRITGSLILVDEGTNETVGAGMIL